MKNKKLIGGLTAFAILLTGIGIGMSTLSSQAAGTTNQNTVFEKMMGGHRGGGEKGMRGFANLTDVTVNTSYLDNGIQETFVGTTDAAKTNLATMADHMQTMEANKPADANSKITVIVTKTSDGFTVTRTSTDATEVARIKAQAQIKELEKKLKDANTDVNALTTRTTTEIDKGVQVTITSDNADVQKLIKLREANKPAEGLGMGMGRGEGKGKGGKCPFMDN